VHRIRKPASTESAPLLRSSLLFKERLQTFAVLSGVGKEKDTKICAGKKTGAQCAVVRCRRVRFPLSIIGREKRARCRQPPPLPCFGPSPIGANFPNVTRRTQRKRNSKKQKMSTKHRGAPDRSPRPRPSSRRRRKTYRSFSSSAFTLREANLC